MSKSTPGPWSDGIYHAVKDGGRTYTYIRSQTADGVVPIGAVVLCVEGCDHSEGEANARLICAAVNACFSINPEHPEKVAQVIEEAFRLLRESHENYRTMNTVQWLLDVGRMFARLQDDPDGKVE